jgi:hypothetical protein
MIHVFQNDFYSSSLNFCPEIFLKLLLNYAFLGFLEIVLKYMYHLELLCKVDIPHQVLVSKGKIAEKALNTLILIFCLSCLDIFFLVVYLFPK